MKLLAGRTIMFLAFTMGLAVVANAQKPKKRDHPKLVQKRPYLKDCKNEADIGGKDVCTNEKMYKHLESVYDYPIYCKVNKIAGTVHVAFTITRKGKFANVKVERSVNPLLDEAALKMVKTLGDFKWLPGEEYGKKVDVRLKLPVTFALKKTTSGQP